MVDIPTVPDTVKAVYPLVRNGTAFNRDLVQQAHLLRIHSLSIVDILRDHLGLDDHATTLETLATNGMQEWRDHLDNHVTNLTTNVAIATAWSSDYLGFGLDSTTQS